MYRYQIAPMMGWTDRHFRYFMRLLGGDSFLLFSEMLTTGAICHGDHARYLQKSPEEGDVILQLGGSDPEALAEAIQIAEAYDYAGYNLNVGCPSDRVQNARIGACLMQEPKLVSELLSAMRSATKRPVSIKTRLGIDGVDSYDYIDKFLQTVVLSGCQEWIIHARDAWLKGLNPKQNRSIPPLRYEYVYQLKNHYPHLHISLNGGLKTQEEIAEALKKVDAVMLGRVAYQNPGLIHQLGGSKINYYTVLSQYIDYIEENITEKNIRAIVVPLVISLSNYSGAKKDRANLASSRQVDEVLQVLQNLKLKLLQLPQC